MAYMSLLVLMGVSRDTAVSPPYVCGYLYVPFRHDDLEHRANLQGLGSGTTYVVCRMSYVRLGPEATSTGFRRSKTIAQHASLAAINKI